MHPYRQTTVSPPQFVGKDAKIENSMITSGCTILGTVINSMLSNNVTVEKGAVVRDSVIMSNTIIREGAVVDFSILDSDVDIGKNATVGTKMSEDAEVTVVGASISINDGETIEAGKIISK